MLSFKEIVKVKAFFQSFWRRGAVWIRKRMPQKPLRGSERDLSLIAAMQGRRMPTMRQLRHVSRLLTPKERVLFRVSAAGFAIGLSWTLFVLVGFFRAQAPAVGGVYVEGVVGSPELVNPVFASANDADTDLVKLIFSGLMRVNEQQQTEPDLASSYQVSPDKKIYTFNLRTGLKWHDGEPFTAKDVVFTVETIQNPVVGSPLLVSFQGLSVRAIGDYKVEFQLKEPFAPFLATVATVGIIPEHAWFDVTPERMYLNKRNLKPIGTGPFQFKQLTKDDAGVISSYELVRFPGFYRGGPWLQGITLQFFSSYDERGLAGNAGVVQALREQRIAGMSFVPRDLRDKVERKHILLRTLPLPQYTALFFNQDQAEVLKDKRLRLALEESIDKTHILNEALQGDGALIAGPILPGFPGYGAKASSTAYAPAEANALLDADWKRVSPSDYKEMRRQELSQNFEFASSSAAAAPPSSTVPLRSASGTASLVERELASELAMAQTFYRKNKSGKILSFTITTADTPEYRRAANLIAGFWQSIGVAVKLQFVPPKDIVRHVLKGRQYDVLLYGLIIGSEPDQYPFWHSSQVDYPGLNLARYGNKKVDAVLSKARETSDTAELADLYKQFQDAIRADRPAIFLYSPTYTYATSDKIKGISINRITHPADRFANVTDWYMKTKGKWNWK